MVKVVLIFLFSIATISYSWIECEIGNNLIVKFPKKAIVDNTFKGYTSYLANNNNCDFSVDISDYPSSVFPKNEKEISILFQQSISRSKEKGVFIDSQEFSFQKIKGIEIKQYFIPIKSSVKYIEVTRKFFLNNELYTLRALFKNKDQTLCEKDCRYFFSSLKLK